MVNFAPRRFSQGRQCRTCRFNAHSPYLVCAVHPAGPEVNPCPDYEGCVYSTEPELPAELLAFWAAIDEELLSFWGPEDLPE